MYKKSQKLHLIRKELENGTLLTIAQQKAGLRSSDTLFKWRKKYPRIDRFITACQSICEEKRITKVEDALYKRAIGYSYKETTIERSSLNPKVKIRKIVIKEVAPDTTAQIFFLMNKAPDNWADKRALVNNYNVIKNTVNPLSGFKDEELDGILVGIIGHPEVASQR